MKERIKLEDLGLDRKNTLKRTGQDDCTGLLLLILGASGML